MRPGVREGRRGEARFRAFAQRFLLSLLLLVPAVALAAVDQMEHFFDTDPGEGLGTPIPIIPGGAPGVPYTVDVSGISTSGLTVGRHTLYLRAYDNVTGWGPKRRYAVEISHPESTIAGAEMFVDRDPGEGNGRPILAPADGAFDGRTESIDTTLGTQGWRAGKHTVYVRARTSLGVWGPPTPVVGWSAPNVTIDENKWAVRAEYFFDQDPGAGRGGELILKTAGGGGPPAAIDLSGIPIEGLGAGTHSLGLRVQDSEGVWGPVRSVSFNVVQTAYTLTGAEVFVETDPGEGAAIPLAPMDGAWDGSSEPVAVVLDATPLAPGPHTLCARARDSTGRWGSVPLVPQYPACMEFEVLAPGDQVIVSGTVSEHGTGRPLNGVTVAGDGRVTRSESDGSFRLVVTKGQRTLTFDASGYYRVENSLTVAAPMSGYDVSMIMMEQAFGEQPNHGQFAEPVNTATGNYYYSRTDIKVTAPGLPFEFNRYYNAQDFSSGELGAKWTHNLDMQVYDWAGVAYVCYGDGRREHFVADGAGNFIPQPGVHNRLTFSAGTYKLLTKELIQYEFDGAGHLITVRDRNANTLAITRDGAGSITTVTDPAGRAYAFAYDTAGYLSSITDPAGRIVRYTVDAAGDLASVTDAEGYTTQYFYDSHHLLLTVVDPRGNVVVANDYDAVQRIVLLQRDALGNGTSFAYDPINRRTTITDPLLGQTTHVYDEQKRLVEEIDPEGHSRTYSYDASHNRTRVANENGVATDYTYDARGNVTSTTVNLGDLVTPDLVTTTVTYDANNNPLTRTDALGNTTRFTYDLAGNLVSVEDPLGATTTFTYDARGLPLTVTDALGNMTENSYDGAGDLIEVRDPLGNATQHAYDGIGRRVSTTDALGNTTSFTYDDNDNLTSLTDPLGNIESYAYDGNGNRVRVTDKLGNATVFGYEQRDLLRRVEDPLAHAATYEYDALRRKTAAMDKNGNRTRFFHDKAGNVTRTMDPAGNETIMTYDPAGQVVATTDAEGRVTAFGYDKLGRLTSVTDANGGIAQYQYDKNGNRTAMTDPNGNTTSYEYDARNRLTRKVEALGNITSYQYDAMGNLVRLTRPDGTAMQYTYDAMNRLSTVTYPDVSTISFGYDANGNRIQMIDGLGTHTYAYDALNRMTAHTGPYGQQVQYGYDANGNRASLIYPGAKTVSYAYDALNRMKTVSDWLGGSTRYSYDSAGRLLSTIYPNGAAAVRSYDGADRLVTLANRKGDSTVISSYAFNRDGVGNILQETRDEPLPPFYIERADTYLHDAENRQVSINGTANAFDANGNMTARGIDVYAYDYENRLIQRDVIGAITEYRYDGLGNRYGRIHEGSATQYVLDTNTRLPNVLAETDAVGSVTAYYVYGLGLVSRIEPDGSAHYYHYDSRGSTIALSDAGGAVTDQYAYEPFGRVINRVGATPNPYTYLGLYGVQDEGDGLLYIRARYYDADTGRFISKDPKAGDVRNGQSLNRYVYALNSPIRLIDYSGFCAQTAGSTPELLLSDSGLSLLYPYASAAAKGLVEQFSNTVTFEMLDMPLLAYSMLHTTLPIASVGASAAVEYGIVKNANVDPSYKAARVTFAAGWSPVGKLVGIGVTAVTLNPAAGFAAATLVAGSGDWMFENAIVPAGENLTKGLDFNPISWGFGLLGQ